MQDEPDDTEYQRQMRQEWRDFNKDMGEVSVKQLVVENLSYIGIGVVIILFAIFGVTKE